MTTAKKTKKPSARHIGKKAKPRKSSVPAQQPKVQKRPQDQILADWWWLLEEAGAETLRPYFGMHIAVVDRQILGSGENSIRLRESVAKRHQLDPESVVIYFVS